MSEKKVSFTAHANEHGNLAEIKSNIALSESYNEAVHEKSTRGYTKSHEILIDSRARDVAMFPNANSFQINFPMNISNVMRIEILDIVFPVPAAITERIGYVRITIGSHNIERGMETRKNFWYTIAIPLHNVDADDFISYNYNDAKTRVLYHFLPMAKNFGNTIKFEVYVWNNATNDFYLMPWVSSGTDPTNNYFTRLEICEQN